MASLQVKVYGEDQVLLVALVASGVSDAKLVKGAVVFSPVRKPAQPWSPGMPLTSTSPYGSGAC